MERIPIIEIFGPTIQGEGMVIGQKTMFVRTAGCDYRCHWCDSSFTWDGSAKDEVEWLTPEQIWQRLKQLGDDRFNHVTISGGNPALLKGLSALVAHLKEKGVRIGLETQGSVWHDSFDNIDDLTISPKPPSSNMETNFATLDMIMDRLATHRGRVSLKVVVFNDQDFSYATYVHQRYPSVPFYVQVGNDHIHEADDATLRFKLLQKLEWLVEQVIQSKHMNDVCVLPQLHTLLWGNRRGV